MKFFDIIKEEGKKEGIEIAEVAIMKVYSILKKTSARLVLEGEGTEKVIGSVLATALPVFESAIEKLADLDKDGQIG